MKIVEVPGINYGGRKILSNVVLCSDGSIFWEPTLFLFHKANNGSKPKSVSSYAQDLIAFLRVVEESRGELNWKNVSDPQMTAYIHSYLQNDKKLKLSTVIRNITTLKSFYYWAWKVRLLERPSCFTFGYDENIPKGDPVSLATSYVSREEFIEIIGSLSSDDSFLIERDELVLEFGYYTGVRANEIVDPRNFETSELRKRVCEARRSNQLSLDIQIVGKGEKLRTIVIPPELFESLEKYLLRRRKKIIDGPLICNEYGASLNRQHASQVFTKATNNANDEVKSRLSVLGYHALRHTYATDLVTWCYENNRDPWQIVQERMGHEDKKTTLGYVSWEAYLNNRLDVLKKLSLGKNKTVFKEYE